MFYSHLKSDDERIFEQISNTLIIEKGQMPTVNAERGFDYAYYQNNQVIATNLLTDMQKTIRDLDGLEGTEIDRDVDIDEDRKLKIEIKAKGLGYELNI